MYLNFHIVKTYCIYLIRHVVIVVVERGGVVADSSIVVVGFCAVVSFSGVLHSSTCGNWL